LTSAFRNLYLPPACRLAGDYVIPTDFLEVRQFLSRFLACLPDRQAAGVALLH
jgi:hypothetical protein